MIPVRGALQVGKTQQTELTLSESPLHWRLVCWLTVFAFFIALALRSAYSTTRMPINPLIDRPSSVIVEDTMSSEYHPLRPHF